MSIRTYILGKIGLTVNTSDPMVFNKYLRSRKLWMGIISITIIVLYSAAVGWSVYIGKHFILLLIVPVASSCIYDMVRGTSTIADTVFGDYTVIEMYTLFHIGELSKSVHQRPEHGIATTVYINRVSLMSELSAMQLVLTSQTVIALSAGPRITESNFFPTNLTLELASHEFTGIRLAAIALCLVNTDTLDGDKYVWYWLWNDYLSVFHCIYHNILTTREQREYEKLYAVLSVMGELNIVDYNEV